jgi:hypothetical protein
VYRQWVRPQRLAFRMHAVPIQTNATVHTIARTGMGANSVTTMAAFGAHHASVLLPPLASQSREIWTAILSWNLATATTGDSLSLPLGLIWRTAH